MRSTCVSSMRHAVVLIILAVTYLKAHPITEQCITRDSLNRLLICQELMQIYLWAATQFNAHLRLQHQIDSLLTSTKHSSDVEGKLVHKQ